MSQANSISSRLSEIRTVIRPEVSDTNDTIVFDVDRGEYDSLSPEVLKVLADEEVSLYQFDELGNRDYCVVL